MIYNKNLLSNAVKIISINHINIKNVPSRKRSLSSVINLKTFPSQSFSYLLEKILSLSLLISLSIFFFNYNLSIVPYSKQFPFDHSLFLLSIVYISKYFPFNCSLLKHSLLNCSLLKTFPFQLFLFNYYPFNCSLLKHSLLNCSLLKTFPFQLFPTQNIFLLIIPL